MIMNREKSSVQKFEKDNWLQMDVTTAHFTKKFWQNFANLEQMNV